MKTKFKRNGKKMLATTIASLLALGTVSGMSVSGESGSESFNAENLYYYMNEDFDDYNGGIPAGWKVASGIDSANLTAEEGGIKINQNQTKLTYLFPESIKTGEFTVEFSIKRSAVDSAWQIRMLDEADVISADMDLTTDVNDTAFKNGNNVFLGNSTELGEENNAKAFVNLGRRGWVGYKADSLEAAGTTEICGTVNVNELTNVKATVNIDAGTCKIKIGAGEEVTKKFQKDRFRIRRLKTEDGQPDIIAYGIRGLQFFKGNGADIIYDNIKVYTKSYNTNQNFEEFVSNKTNAHFGWWYAGNVNLNNTQTGNYILDPITDSEKNGLKLNGANVDDSVNKNRVAVTPLNMPISAGRNFTVEFDLCLNNNGASSIFNVLTLDKEDLFYTSTNTNNNTEPQNNVGIDAAAEKEMLSANIIFNEAKDQGIIVADGLYARGSKVKTGAEDDSENLIIPLGQWHHVKLVVTPEKNIGYITYNGQTYTAEYPNAKPNMEVAGIGFSCTAKYTTPYIDNLKVYENDAVNTISVTSVKADGQKIDDSVIDAETKQLSVELSNPINSADAVELYHKNSNGLKSYVAADKALSEDKKCVTFSNISGLTSKEELVLALVGNAEGENSSFDNIEKYVNYITVDNVFVAGKPKLQEKTGDDATTWTDISTDVIQQGKNYRVYADIRNAENAPENTDITYIAALYDGEQLKYVNNVNWNNSSADANVTVEIPNDISYTSIRLFAWSGNSFKPIYTDSLFTVGADE